MKTVKSIFLRLRGIFPKAFVIPSPLLSTLLILSILLFGCDLGGNVGKEATEIIAEDIIPQVTAESTNWREDLKEALDKLPEDTRREVEIAIERAIQSAGAEFRCDTDFINTRLKQNLQGIRNELMGGDTPSKKPQVCGVYPNSVIELDEDPIAERQ